MGRRYPFETVASLCSLCVGVIPFDFFSNLQGIILNFLGDFNKVFGDLWPLSCNTFPLIDDPPRTDGSDNCAVAGKAFADVSKMAGELDRCLTGDFEGISKIEAWAFTS